MSDIVVQAQGSERRRYHLSYSTGSNGRNSLLARIAESGKDDTGQQITLPATVFSYQTKQVGWTENSSWSIPEVFGAWPLEDYGVEFGDVNGDGLPDLLKVEDTQGNGKVYINTGNSLVLNSNWPLPTDIHFNSEYNAPPPADVLDVNGDGLADIVQGGNSNYPPKTYINIGDGRWGADQAWIPPVYFSTNSGDNGVRWADVNGDGLVDIVQAIEHWTGAGINQGVYLNTGNGWQESTSFQLPADFYFSRLTSNYSSQSAYAQMVDVNGDSLPDIIQNNAGIYLNTGNGTWQLSTQYALPTQLTRIDEREYNRLRYEDVNNDGYIDILRAERLYTTTDGSTYTDTNEVYINNGTTGWK